MSTEERDYLEPEIQLYPRRWLVLAIFALSNVMTSIIQLSFASIQNLTLDYFQLGNATWKVNLMSVSYMVKFLISPRHVIFRVPLSLDYF